MLRASAPTIAMPIDMHKLSGFSLHASSSPERSSTPFPEGAGSGRFDYPFPTTQTHSTQGMQSPPACAAHAMPSPSSSSSPASSPSTSCYGLPPTSLLPSPSSPWPSPTTITPPLHTPRKVHPYSSPRSGPSSPVAALPPVHRHGVHAHVAPVRLCAQASAKAPMPPSLARKMSAVVSPRA